MPILKFAAKHGCGLVFFLYVLLYNLWSKSFWNLMHTFANEIDWFDFQLYIICKYPGYIHSFVWKNQTSPLRPPFVFKSHCDKVLFPSVLFWCLWWPLVTMSAGGSRWWQAIQEDVKSRVATFGARAPQHNTPGFKRVQWQPKRSTQDSSA